jgi:sialate O-acetylesterase
MFQDHAVLQRDRPIAVYGAAEPGATVKVTLASASVETKAGKDGHWQLSLPAMTAGGPYTLRAESGGAAEQISDLLIGDVFLCTGQSNMQLTVSRVQNAEMEARNATDSNIRQLTIATHESVSPLSTFATPVEWMVASPGTASRFSASCYFFARELRKAQQVPVGLVVSAWGGSRVRAWVSEASLRKLGLFNDDLDMLALYRKNPQGAQRRWDAKWESWWLAHSKERPWEDSYSTSNWAEAPAALGPWALWNSDSPDGFVGQMWMRTSVTLTAAQAAQPAVLDLGAVNEEDKSWVNGKGVGGTSWSRAARHEIPKGVLRAGENSITTNIFCSWRNCGMSGPAETRAIRFADGSSVPLSNVWRYAPVPDLIAPQIPWGPTHGVSMDYNGMLAPIGPYGVRAAIWYQGESNIYFAGTYQATLAAMMADWRRVFGADLPFIIVQIPNYGPLPTKPVESGWSEVREAQRRAALADSHAAYVVTIDLGAAKELHPVNKQDVGRRIAQAARHIVYGEKIPPSGPRPVAAARHNGQISVSFTDVTGGLAAVSGNPNAFEVCEAARGACRFVNARIDGNDRVVLDIPPQVTPTRVRYCWGDSPVCTLSDQSELPATPFELAVP